MSEEQVFYVVAEESSPYDGGRRVPRRHLRSYADKDVAREFAAQHSELLRKWGTRASAERAVAERHGRTVAPLHRPIAVMLEFPLFERTGRNVQSSLYQISEEGEKRAQWDRWPPRQQPQDSASADDGELDTLFIVTEPTLDSKSTRPVRAYADRELARRFAAEHDEHLKKWHADLREEAKEWKGPDGRPLKASPMPISKVEEFPVFSKTGRSITASAFSLRKGQMAIIPKSWGIPEEEIADQIEKRSDLKSRATKIAEDAKAKRERGAGRGRSL